MFTDNSLSSTYHISSYTEIDSIKSIFHALENYRVVLFRKVAS